MDSSKTIYETTVEEREEIHNIWDYLRFIENTQAFHLVSVIGFEEWIAMEEIKRRIKELFNIEYKNERSLYPYIKTLVDCGLFEVSNVGGKRKWRRKELIVAVKSRKKKQLEEVRVLESS
ncbi:MAG: hypothetical protein J4478_04635 [Candidatus Diapherotrites archaeon]|uniref:Uncharacterized protein n=1 Tax=Candidatus Iainarchaeum sp. TaxID=3101447 RepID=A0A8T4L6S6_9ARCH|nr:hypothetical protein [Candidatus Diapherotrites archaeon]